MVEAQRFSPREKVVRKARPNRSHACTNEMARDRIDMTTRLRDTQSDTIQCTTPSLFFYDLQTYAITHKTFTQFNPHIYLFGCSTRFGAATAEGHRICPSRPRRAGFRPRLQMTRPPTTHPVHVSCEQCKTLALASSPPEPRRPGVASIS